MKEPRLIFKEFTDEWKEVHIGDVVAIYDNSRVPVKRQDREKGSVKYYGANGIQDYVSGFTHDGEYILIAEDETESINLNNYPIHYTKGKIWVNNHAHVVSGLNNKADNLFLKNCLSTINWNKYLVAGGGRYKLTSSSMKQIIIDIPTLKEQQKIGSFFSDIDKQIELQSDKLENLKRAKKGYLQKMFPSDDSNEPKLRLKCFGNDWKKMKLDNLCSFINGRAYKQEELLKKGKYKVIRVGNFYTDHNMYYSNMELDNNKYIDKEDLVYTWSATFGPHIWKGDKSIYHYHIWKVKINNELADKKFILQILDIDRNKMKTNGGTMAHITKSSMENKIVFVPELKEQQMIGMFFSNLDKQIELLQQKVDNLKNQKKAYLQKMFI